MIPLKQREPKTFDKIAIDLQKIPGPNSPLIANEDL